VPGPSSPARNQRIALGAISVAILLLLGTGWWFVVEDSESPTEQPNVPIAHVLALNTGTPECSAGNASAAWNCSYVFLVTLRNTGGPTPSLVLNSLAFLVVESGGALSRVPFSVTVLTTTECAVGAYNSTINTWGSPIDARSCGSNDPGNSPLVSGDELALATIPPAGLPFSGGGYQLESIRVGEFSGSTLTQIG
jgi:hypothetical protein